jgi:pimeloyl-ACP methyl ester carboxylesterase
MGTSRGGGNAPRREGPRKAVTGTGRRVAYEVHGDPEGQPVVYLHGVPSSRLEVHVFDLPAAARRAGVQLVAIDRAGVGDTDPHPDRRLTDTAADVIAVADTLGHRRFALVGYSGGSPFALTAAACLADRVTALGIVSGIGPGDRPDLAEAQADEVARLFRWARSRPRLLKTVLFGMKLATRRPETLVRTASTGAPACDAAVLARPGAAQDFAAFLALALRAGVAGVATDFALAAGSWSSHAAEVTVPTLIWHGELDRNAPAAAARWLDTQLPDSRLPLHPDHGHASLIANRGQEIFRALTAAAHGPP